MSPESRVSLLVLLRRSGAANRRLLAAESHQERDAAWREYDATHTLVRQRLAEIEARRVELGRPCCRWGEEREWAEDELPLFKEAGV
jgi:hypothetical protein